jgi:hypothetical protein
VIVPRAPLATAPGIRTPAPAKTEEARRANARTTHPAGPRAGTIRGACPRSHAGLRQRCRRGRSRRARRTRRTRSPPAVESEATGSRRRTAVCSRSATPFSRRHGRAAPQLAGGRNRQDARQQGLSAAGSLADFSAPLADAVRAAGAPGLVPVVRAGAAIAALGSLLALILGVSRTTLAMARDLTPASRPDRRPSAFRRSPPRGTRRRRRRRHRGRDNGRTRHRRRPRCPGRPRRRSLVRRKRRAYSSASARSPIRGRT